jgi:type II secretory pathway pseudopilin PulG
VTEPVAPESAGPQPAGRSRGFWLTILAVAALVALLAAWVAYGYGQRSAGRDVTAEAQRRESLEEQVDRLKTENERLHARVAELEMSRRLDRDAYTEVERTLGALQGQLARQGDDLAFYRSIVSPEDGIQGLRIQRFDVTAGTAPREFLLKLTLVQAMRHESIVSGLAQITIAGMQGDTPRKYTVGELLGQPRAQLPFSFRYFQTVEQTVTLPEGFEPFETSVRLQSGKLRGGPVEQAFPWKAAPANPA